MPPTITWDLERWKSHPIGPVTASDLLNTVECAIYPLAEPGSPLFSDERMHHHVAMNGFAIDYWIGRPLLVPPIGEYVSRVNYSRTRVNLWRFTKDPGLDDLRSVKKYSHKYNTQDGNMLIKDDFY